ncbi:MAG: hypothetical protein WBL50_14785 [Candidatus Acidiferrum sp.]
MSSATDPLVAEIVESLRLRYRTTNPYYEAGWTESWSHRRCLHKHYTLTAAARCAMPQGAGWYVFAVENGQPRQLDDTEENIVNSFRFARTRSESTQQILLSLITTRPDFRR